MSLLYSPKRERQGSELVRRLLARYGLGIPGTSILILRQKASAKL